MSQVPSLHNSLRYRAKLPSEVKNASGLPVGRLTERFMIDRMIQTGF